MHSFACILTTSSRLAHRRSRAASTSTGPSPSSSRRHACLAYGLCPGVMLLGLLGSPANAVDITSLPFVINAPGTYTLTADLEYNPLGSAAAIGVLANDVILDLGGHTLSTAEPNAYGIYVLGVSGVTVMNGTVADFSIQTGITLDSATGCTISGLTVSNCGWGIVLSDATGKTIENNTLDENLFAGIGLGNASTNVVQGNTCLLGSWGIRLFGSSNGNSLLANTCDGSFGEAIDLTGTDGNIIVGNTSTNAWIGISGYTSDANHLENNTASGNEWGIYLYGGANTLTKNTSNGNGVGFYLSVTGSTVHDNTANGGSTGFYLPDCSGSTITKNTANGNINDGIILWTSSGPSGGNTVKKNTANGNGFGIRVVGCNDNEVKDNTANGNVYYGIHMWASVGNAIEKNTSLSNGFVDLVDDSPCGSNVWRRNVFVTSSGECIQ